MARRQQVKLLLSLVAAERRPDEEYGGCGRGAPGKSGNPHRLVARGIPPTQRRHVSIIPGSSSWSNNPGKEVPLGRSPVPPQAGSSQLFYQSSNTTDGAGSPCGDPVLCWRRDGTKAALAAVSYVGEVVEIGRVARGGDRRTWRGTCRLIRWLAGIARAVEDRRVLYQLNFCAAIEHMVGARRVRERTTQRDHLGSESWKMPGRRRVWRWPSWVRGQSW